MNIQKLSEFQPIDEVGADLPPPPPPHPPGEIGLRVKDVPKIDSPSLYPPIRKCPIPKLKLWHVFCLNLSVINYFSALKGHESVRIWCHIQHLLRVSRIFTFWAYLEIKGNTSKNQISEIVNWNFQYTGRFFLTGPLLTMSLDWPAKTFSQCWNHIHFARHLDVFWSWGPFWDFNVFLKSVTYRPTNSGEAQLKKSTCTLLRLWLCLATTSPSSSTSSSEAAL